jgi:hypothetical protein
MSLAGFRTPLRRFRQNNKRAAVWLSDPDHFDWISTEEGVIMALLVEPGYCTT